MANAIKNVKFTNDYDVEAADIERQRRMAEALQQQGMAGGRPTEMVGGWAIPQSPLEGVGRVAQQVAGKYQQDKLTERQKALAEAMRTKGNDEAQQFVGALQGTPAQPEVPMPADELGGGPGRPEMAAVPGDRNKALAIAMQSQNPMVQAGGGSIMADMLKKPDAFTLKPGETRFQGNQPVVNVPAAPVKPTQHVIDGKVYENQGDKLVEIGGPGKAPDFNKPFLADGSPNPAYQAYELSRAAAGKSNTNNTVINAGPKAFETELGKLDAEQLGKYRDNAQTAQTTLNTVNALRDAVTKGVYSGGGANLKAEASNIINGLTGATPKGLVGSQLFNAEASKLVLAQVKQLGTNPSNTDREFVEKTIPRLGSSPEARDQLINFLEQKSKEQIDLYQRADSHARANRGLGGFNVVTPSASPSGDRRSAPRTGNRVVVDY